MNIQLLLSVAFDELDGAVGVAAGEGLGIEVTLYDTAWLMSGSALADAAARREDFDARQLAITTHGPLFDLNPGSLDPTIRTYSRDCFLRGIEVSTALGARKIVFHTFFNPLLPRGVLRGWKELARPIWREALDRAEAGGVTICLENSYEGTAEFFKELFTSFDDGRMRMCYDPAHVHLYSRDGQAAWVVTLGHLVTHLHLNDNVGVSDDHLALGQGEIPYASFLPDLCSACGEATVVLEMTVEKALQSLEYLHDLGLRG